MDLSNKKPIHYHEKYGKCNTFDAETIDAIKNLYRTIANDPEILVTSITGLPSQGATSEDAFVLLLANLTRL